MSGQGRFKAMGHKPSKPAIRNKRDFYETPAWVTQKFLEAEREALWPHLTHEHAIWEPCAGGGAIRDVLLTAGYRVISTDLEPTDRSRITQLDVLGVTDRWSPIVVTNPPYSLCSGPSAPLVAHLLDLGVDYLALLLPSDWLWPISRDGLLAVHPVSRVWTITPRIDWDGRGAPSQTHGWHIWDKNHRGPTQLLRQG